MKKWVTKHGITVIRLELTRCNCYVIRTEKENWLVDAGTIRSRKKLLQLLQNCYISAIDGVILTHAHINHVENVAWIADRYHCPVYVHDSELHFVQTGDCLIPKAAKGYLNLAERLLREAPFLNKYPACRDAKAITFDEPIIWDEHIRLLETPGHSEGSVSIIVDDELALVGDAMSKRAFFGVNQLWANQPGLVSVTWKKLLQESCQWYIPSHGGAISRRQVERKLK